MKTKITKFVLLVLFANCAFVQAEPVQFTLTDLNGKHHTIKDYAGKWLVVNYWATWCPPCLDEIPELIAFHDKHKGNDAYVLGVNFEKIDKKQLRQFVEESFISYPVLQTQPSSRSSFGIVYGLPTTFLVSPEGEVVASKTGGVTQLDLEQSIAFYSKQLKKNSKSNKE